MLRFIWQLQSSDFALNSHLFFFFPQQHVCSHIVTLPHFLFSCFFLSLKCLSIWSPHSCPVHPLVPHWLHVSRSFWLVMEIFTPSQLCVCVFIHLACSAMGTALTAGVKWQLHDALSLSPCLHLFLYPQTHRHTHAYVLLTCLVPSQPL